MFEGDFMRYMKSWEIRQMWLDFFKSKGHSVEPSAPLVPINDPTLLWTNAGVTPLKKYFDGSMVPENPRITNAQKCIRTNDIENVGKTARHHTFFEMLGNFSIGDYFKPEAIKFAVELLFDEKWFGFDKNKLYITYYTKDLDAKKYWMENGIAEDHLVPLDGNFWEIGEGPCGPDTEMFYDRGEKYDKRGVELLQNDIENDRFIEIWNIVFSQFNSKAGVARENYKELPSKNIDTGCGLERLCCIMQGVDTNYDTDLFMPIIKKTEEISGVKYTGQMAFKVIADHVRTVSFAVADGALMSNEGRGYVLRRVLRRASKYAKSLGINRPFMSELVDVVIEIMDPFYPYLKEKQDIVKKVISKEEEKFLETLQAGEKKFEAISKASNGVISGKDAFLLYDTYGFPIELTIEYAEELGMKVDEEGFKAALQEQKIRAKNARKDENSFASQNEEFLKYKEKSEFVGYEELEITSKVIAKFGNSVVTEKTPFYAVSGGQLADDGFVGEYEVLDVIKMPNGQHLHVLPENDLQVGDEVSLVVDAELRDLTRKNHSSAHLFQHALQTVLGEHVHQQGQQVCSEYMRFDFNNYNSLTNEEILKVEDMVNGFIKDAYAVKTLVLPIEEAKKMGAMALFGEKYGKVVRVVDMNVSKEFCGGTHVANTEDIKHFYISSVESIGSGIFRCLAHTGVEAQELIKADNKNILNTIDVLKAKASDIIAKAKSEGIELANAKLLNTDITEVGFRYVLALQKLQAEYQNLTKELEKEYNQKKNSQEIKKLDKFYDLIENNKLFIKLENTDSNLLKDMATTLKNNKSLDLVLIAGYDANKVSFIAATSAKYSAVEVVREATKITGGGGGGKPDLAQAGGKDVTKIDEAINHLKEMYL